MAHFALRVPLLEVLCAGAEPIAVIDDLCVELEPLGAQMIAEICRLAAEAGVAPRGDHRQHRGQRGHGGHRDQGVTVLGRRRPGRRVGGGSQPGDLLVCAGLPISAPHHEVYIGHPDQVSVAAVTASLASGGRP